MKNTGENDTLCVSFKQVTNCGGVIKDIVFRLTIYTHQYSCFSCAVEKRQIEANIFHFHLNNFIHDNHEFRQYTTTNTLAYPVQLEKKKHLC